MGWSGLLLSANMAAAWSEISKNKKTQGRKNLQGGKIRVSSPKIMEWQVKRTFFNSWLENCEYGPQIAGSPPFCLLCHDILFGLLNYLYQLFCFLSQEISLAQSKVAFLSSRGSLRFGSTLSLHVFDNEDLCSNCIINCKILIIYNFQNKTNTLVGYNR